MHSGVNAISLLNTMAKNSSINATRQLNGTWKEKGFKNYLDGHPIQEQLMKYAPHILERHGNPETADFEQHGRKGLYRLEVAGVSFGEFALSGIKIMDTLTVGTAWLTGFNYIAQQEAKRGNLNAEQDAADIVNGIISDSQPPSISHERSLGQTDNEWLRSVLPFSGQTMVNWQNWMYGVMVPSLQMLKEGNIRGLLKSEGHYSSIVQRNALGFMLPALALGLLSRRRWFKDKDEMAWDMFFYPVQQIPIFGNNLVYGLTTGWRDAESQSIPLSVMNGVMTAVIDFSNTIKGDKEFGFKEQRNFIESVSILSSFPTSYAHFFHVLGTELSKGNGWAELNQEEFRDALGLSIKD